MIAKLHSRKVKVQITTNHHQEGNPSLKDIHLDLILKFLKNNYRIII